MPVSIHKSGHVNRRSVNHAHGEFVRHMAHAHDRHVHSICLLWSPYGIGQIIIFLPRGFYLLSFFSSPNLSSWRLDVYHTSTHGVALVRI